MKRNKENKDSNGNMKHTKENSNAQQALYNKKPKCMDKISSKAARVAERSKILDSRINGDDVDKQPKHHSQLISKLHHTVDGDDDANFVLKEAVDKQLDYAGSQLIYLTPHFPSDVDHGDLVPNAEVNRQLEH
ncbi:hypothetical protein DAPPUDRAFT_333364 [Daphnia pulex]|uniref:Uncharacterized protein n=1 Tax=Daphnia pulex TaxID=6669 RepID=E9HSM7_DAPPU|nr:hypothetical protein DAPPUDRAFT_333364 [Daphnia pulex]|eukprot:EFX65260.1 hypothetical protein DAPPUDRAFT_333364 [Daphnia pulex]